MEGVVLGVFEVPDESMDLLLARIEVMRSHDPHRGTTRLIVHSLTRNEELHGLKGVLNGGGVDEQA